jgi:DNA adenine methylase
MPRSWAVDLAADAVASRPGGSREVAQTRRRGPAKPFLKWAGGKGASLPRLLARLPERVRDEVTYHEPFVGGGALFFALRPRRAILTDLNERLVRTYRAVRDNPSEVVGRLREMEAIHRKRGAAYFYEVRQREVDQLADVDVASWLIYLNRTCFNGLYRVNRAGRFNVPAGRHTNPTVCDEETLSSSSQALQGADICVADFREALSRVRPGDVVYCDPPYLPLSAKGHTAYTAAGFTPADHTELRDVVLTLKRRGAYVLLSNSASSATDHLYRRPPFEIEQLAVRRNINSDGARREAVGEYLIW